VASSYHGRPRSTHDADIVIDPAAEPLARLVRRLAAAGFYVDAAQAQDALRRRRQFNVIERWAAELGIMDLWQEIAAHRPPEA
jgi:hypothetical protein